MMTEINGLITWDEAHIDLRDHLVKTISREVTLGLCKTNAAWHTIRIETPILTAEVSNSYNADDYFAVLGSGGLFLRPETTKGTFAYARKLLSSHPKKWEKPPVCVWQAGKSFRNEQDQPRKFCRLKEFYQLEFQCIYTRDSNCDYKMRMVLYMQAYLSRALRTEVRVIPSDRLPEYSLETTDLEVMHYGRWMEIASISTRTDFDEQHYVLELAFGLDRITTVAGEI